MQKYPSMTSVHSMLSLGHLPPGHGYIPKKVKPDKPYGPSFNSVMNRTWRGPGRKYINYAIFTFCIFILFVCAAGLYVGHRNVSRMIVFRTEVFGAIFTVIAILLLALMFHLIYKARVESNRWRGYVRFRAEGMFVAAAYNPVYSPEDDMRLKTGTYGRKALREIPKPRAGRKGRSRAGSKSAQPGGMQRGIFEKNAQSGNPPQAPSQAPPQGVPQGYPQGQPQGIPQGQPQGYPQGIPQGHPQGYPQGIPQGPPSGHPQGPAPGAFQPYPGGPGQAQRLPPSQPGQFYPPPPPPPEGMYAQVQRPARPPAGAARMAPTSEADL